MAIVHEGETKKFNIDEHETGFADLRPLGALARTNTSLHNHFGKPRHFSTFQS